MISFTASPILHSAHNHHILDIADLDWDASFTFSDYADLEDAMDCQSDEYLNQIQPFNPNTELSLSPSNCMQDIHIEDTTGPEYFGLCDTSYYESINEEPTFTLDLSSATSSPLLSSNISEVASDVSNDTGVSDMFFMIDSATSSTSFDSTSPDLSLLSESPASLSPVSITLPVTESPPCLPTEEESPAMLYNNLVNLMASIKADVEPNFQKPDLSYVELVGRAILSASEDTVLLADIYEWILSNYPYFRTAKASWKSSVRHHLSVSECFSKGTRARNGRGFNWTIHPAFLEDFRMGDFTRRNGRRHALQVNRNPSAIPPGNSCHILHNSAYSQTMQFNQAEQRPSLSSQHQLQNQSSSSSLKSGISATPYVTDFVTYNHQNLHWMDHGENSHNLNFVQTLAPTLCFQKL